MVLPADKFQGLQAPLQTLATNFFQAAKDSLGIDLVLIAALRPLDAQHALYEQGRTTPGPIVTNADAGQSWHNWGYAFDVGIQDPVTGATTLPDASDPRCAQLGSLGESLGLIWGGTFSG